MKTKIVAGLIVIVTIVAASIFAGCIEEKIPASTSPPKPVSTPTSETPLSDIHQGCFYPSGRDIWICNNYQATKTYLEFEIRKGIPREVGTVGIAHTTGKYVLIYSLPRVGSQVPFFEIYEPSEDWAHDLGYSEDLEKYGITVTNYELVWKT